MSRFQMQQPREDTVSALLKAAAGDAAAMAFFVGVETFYPGLLEERLKARAARRTRKAPGYFQMARAAINAKRQPPPPLIIEDERGEFLRAIEQTLASMPFGKQSFDAVNDILKNERKKYAAHSVRKPRKVGSSSSEQVKKGYALYQRAVESGEPPDWEAIAYECLKRPGEDTPKATWKQRKEKFRKAVDGHRYRLKREARLREK